MQLFWSYELMNQDALKKQEFERKLDDCKFAFLFKVYTLIRPSFKNERAAQRRSEEESD